MVRISVDVWFQMLFSLFGLDGLTATLLIAAMIGAFILYRGRGSHPTLKWRYFIWLLAECVVYAILFAILISQFLELILNLNAQDNLSQLSKLQLYALSLGAGLYEELFFRVILVSGFFYVFRNLFEKSKYAYAVAAVISALIFSSVHYIGDFADSWALGSFLFRFLFGLTLNVIYVIRGFGCAAWTHAIYDLIVVFRL